ncbi:disulfide bond formation protein B [Acidisoma sp. C75]
MTQISADRRTAGFLLLAGLAALLLAYGAQDLLGMVPCELCLWERWPYRILVALGLLGLLLPAGLPRGLRRALLWLALLALSANVAIAFVHVGVEHGWWPSPLPECNASNLLTTNLSQLMARLPARPAKPCDAPSFLIPGLPLSFATMDLLYALLCLGLLTVRLRRPAIG